MKTMAGLLQFLFDMGRSFRDPKRAAGTSGIVGLALMSGQWINLEIKEVKADVQQKHVRVVSQITTFNENQVKILTALASIQTGMSYLKEGVDETKVTLDRTREKVSEMANTVSAIRIMNN